MSEMKPREPVSVDRPRLPAGYHAPRDDADLLPWSWAAERLERAINYWVASVRPDARPHSMPTWGVWMDNTFYFEGSPETRRMRNIAANPAVVVHLESGDEVVVVEGAAVAIPRPDAALSAQLVAAFAAKYLANHGYQPDPKDWEDGGLYAAQPETVLGWREFPKTATRWRFARG
jgi:nitroimidazol reductase NimA-like FMN-containing flavoprotein (pyridoxamine 5'-phosphate oxidase superfamily)